MKLTINPGQYPERFKGSEVWKNLSAYETELSKPNQTSI